MKITEHVITVDGHGNVREDKQFDIVSYLGTIYHGGFRVYRFHKGSFQRLEVKRIKSEKYTYEWADIEKFERN